MEIDNKNDFISNHFPFIIKTVSSFTKRYVEVENSEELSIAIEAFNHAIDCYEEGKGKFFSYAKKVIINRLIDESRKKPKEIQIDLDDSQIGYYEHFEEDTLCKIELKNYEESLFLFHISWDDLIQTAPKHNDTRLKVFNLAIQISQDKDMIHKIFEKKRLPITETSNQYGVSKKFLKLHKELIIAIVIAYEKKINIIMQWIQSIIGGKNDENRNDS